MTANELVNRVPSSSTRLALCAALVSLALAGCPTEPLPQPPAPAPQIVSFTSSSAKVSAGEPVTLTWETKDAVSIELTEQTLGLVSGVESTALSGSVEVTPAGHSLYVLTATNERGLRDSAIVAVSVRGAPKEVSFIAAPGKISAGEPATLAWTAPGAQAVSLATADGQPVEIGAQKDQGTVEVRPTSTTTYQLTVDGAQFEAQVEVAPMVVAFAVSPESATPNQPLTLSWSTSGAVKVTVLGAARGELHSETNPSAVADGTFTETVAGDIDPAAALTYVLRAESASGEVTERSLTVYVARQPQVLSFGAPRYVTEGTLFTATWTTAEADVVEILRDGTAIFASASPAEAAAGSVQLPAPEAEATFVLRARHTRGGVALSEAVQVEPIGAPAQPVFTSTPQGGIANGGELVTLEWTSDNARNAVVTRDDGRVIAVVTGVAAEMGSIPVYPNRDTTYSLVVDNGAGGTAGPETVALTVGTPAKLIFSPAAVPAGSPITVTGTTAPNGGDIVGLPAVVHNAAGEQFIDISSTGTSISYSGPDTTSKLVTLPELFSVPLFGVPVAGDKVAISINGWFAFRTASMTGVDGTGTLPSTNFAESAFVPYHDDLRDTSNSEIYYRLDDVGTERRLIIQWNRVSIDSGNSVVTGSELTFQAQLYSGGKVVFAYDAMTGFTPGAPVIGVQNNARDNAITTSVVPVQGDTFTFFGQMTPPVTITASNDPIVATVLMPGGGFLELTDQTPLFPSDLFSISELNVQPLVTDGQWFEVVNHSPDAHDLAGWVLDFGGGNTHTIAGSLLLPANGRLVFAQAAGANDGLTVDYVYGTGFSVPQGGGLAVNIGTVPYTTLPLPQASLPAGRTWQHGVPATGMTVATGVTTLECVTADALGYGTAGQFGTPGQPNTPCPNYLAPVSVPGNFESIAATGTPVVFPNLDDDAVMIQLPSPILLDRIPITQLWVGTNGFISPQPFTCPQYCYSGNKTAPDPDTAPVGLLAPFWDDLDTTSAGAVYWERKDPDAIANNGDEYVIVSWEGVHRFDVPTDVLNFQVKFLPGGHIEYHYGLMAAADMASATTWFEHPSGGAAFVVNVNSASPGISSNSGYRLPAL